MLITCPSCASRYELDAAKLGETGRKVRCASCQALWHVEPPPEFPAFPEAPSSEETAALLDEELRRAAEIDDQVSALTAERAAEAEPPPPPSARRRRKGRDSTPRPPLTTRLRNLGMPVALALGGVAVLGLLAWKRDFAVRTAPQLAVVFETLGLPVNIRGLTLTSVESGLVQDLQGRFLVVEGDVTNITRSTTEVPLIEISVKDAANQVLYTWTTEPPRERLEPSELVRFRARLATPPENGQSVQVRFTSTKPTGLANAH
ncbi:zinc-ribbon domain-containing protein [Bosea sp. BK604]|uniref:zinc-ribbon domain-containing protein n=1 Tax=Bosea sp. BK604 TaxID=2512180 RepID=UPI001048E0D1|nr:zinc-ribbon domain-containing protein [Bosea sp. BK604]TCR67227.1 LSD1 subclass zinc finger protein [Bosea sp. BK604]